jgi:hypothetical protein
MSYFLTVLNYTYTQQSSVFVDIYSPDVVDLTLIDLPGAIRSVKQGQSKSIITEIKTMIEDKIEPDNVCIVFGIYLIKSD